MDEIAAPAWEDLDVPAPQPAVTASQFRKRVIAKESTEGLGFMKRLGTKAIEVGKSRELHVVTTASTVDLDNETVSVPGTDLAFYKTNPILLPNHDRLQLPIGVAVKLAKYKDELRASFRYAPPEVSQLADSFLQNHLWRMEQKALGDTGAMYSIWAVPIGKNAYEFNRRRGGLDFKKQQLREISDVTIGAQQRAQVLAAKAAGVPMEPVLEWALDLVKADDGLLVLDRSEAEAIVKTLDPSKGLEIFEIKAPEKAADEGGPDEEEVDGPDETSDRFREIEKRLAALEAPEPAAAEINADEAPEPEKGAELTTEEIDKLATEALRKIEKRLVATIGAGL